MIPAIRQRYNAAFTEARYTAFTQELNQSMYWPVDFRVAESPLFIDEATTRALIAASGDIVGQLAKPAFRAHAKAAIPAISRNPLKLSVSRSMRLRTTAPTADDTPMAADRTLSTVL